MKYLIISIKILLFLYFSYILYFFFGDFNPASVSYRPPVFVWLLDIINLYIHEAGHFFFKIFGRWMYFLGGSLFQCLVPLALVIVTWRQNISNVGYAGFWLGESLINVSVYIKDAPYKQLHLIASGLIHDWNWLLSDDLGIAELLGDIVFVSGISICVASIIIGIVYAVIDFRWYRERPFPE